MNLVAMTMCGPGEDKRYLAPCLEHLLEFCDEVRVRNEGGDWDVPRSLNLRRVRVKNAAPTFFQHEGQARQELLDWTMEANPTHILAVDMDEFVADGAKLRAAMEAGGQNGIWKLEMTEIWGADEDGLNVRTDGHWPPRPVGIAFEVPQDHHNNRQKRRHWRLPPTAGGCGRVPMLTQAAANRTSVKPTTEILHFGWACKADRQARYDRYANRAGFGHDNRHIESIMFGDDRVSIARMPWPESLDKATLLARVERT